MLWQSCTLQEEDDSDVEVVEKPAQKVLDRVASQVHSCVRV